MTYDTQLIWKLFENIDCNYDKEAFTEEECEWLAEEVMTNNSSFSWDYEVGATKLVLIAEELDYVIKIPFNGANNWAVGFQDFYGLPEGVYDYCQYEQELYDKAFFAGVREMFLPLIFVDRIKTIPVYIQEKVSCFYAPRTYSKNSEEYLKEKLKRNEGYLSHKIPFNWIAQVMDFLGSVEKFENFMNFIKKEHIDLDLHVNNVGFINGRPIILDYGGYFEEVQK